MGLTRTDIYSDQQNKLASLCKAIGHPARVAILEHLIAKNACICGELVNEIGLAQATISQHLKELKNCGLIIGNIEGTKVCYCINPEIFMQLKDFFNNLISKMNCDDSCC